MSVDYIKARDLIEGDVFSNDDGENWQTVVAVADGGYETARITVIYTEAGELDIDSDEYVYVKDST